MNIRKKAASMRLLQIALFPCLVTPVLAQGPNTDALDEIVVTATRMESSVRDVARSVSIVNKESRS
jgi:outer membrane cobalamin receptor